MDIIIQSLAAVYNPMTLLLVSIGVLFGMVCGALPGLSTSMAIILLLPFTYSMDPVMAIVLMVSCYVGGSSGGSISSILLKTPGTQEAVATTFDGYPMAQKGKAGEALTAAFTSSFVGALFAVIMITLVAPLVAKFALQFGPAEKFAVFFIAFCSFIGMGKEPPFKTIVAMMIGFALASLPPGLVGV